MLDATRAPSSIEITPLTPTIGAEVLGVDLTKRLDEETVQIIRRALLDHLVIFFRDQALSLDQLDAFGERFGKAHIHPTERGVEGHPGILRIHNDAHSKVYAGRMWHSDVTCDIEPPMASILHLHEVPESGGDTLFASMYAAYDALSAPMRAWLGTLDAVHESVRNLGGYFGAKQKDLRDGYFPEGMHPVVCTHPETGRKLLFVNEAFTTRIAGLEPAESKAVLDFLYSHIGSPKFQCRFRWRKNSIAFWDNRCAQHLALWDYYPNVRSGHRFTIAGNRPLR